MLLCVYTYKILQLHLKMVAKIVAGSGWATFFSARAGDESAHSLPYSQQSPESLGA